MLFPKRGLYNYDARIARLNLITGQIHARNLYIRVIVLKQLILNHLLCTITVKFDYTQYQPRTCASLWINHSSWGKGNSIESFRERCVNIEMGRVLKIEP